LSQDGTLGEDFTAFSLGLSWKADRWAARTRAEYRNGEFADRRGLSAAVIREMDEGKMVGGGFTWTRATAPTGATSEVAEASLTLALRPADSNLANLSKIEFRSDAIKGAVTGGISPVGQTALLVTGNAHSRRLIASTAFNWTPHTGGGQGATEVEGFAAMRHSLDRTPDLSLAGTSVLGGFDLRVGLGAHVQIGGRATVRHNLTDGTTRFAAGPEVAFSPAENMVVSLGYNVIGFRDPDFAESRTTDRGVFASVKLKFDADSFGFLGLHR
jgi:hypothetical protein